MKKLLVVDNLSLGNMYNVDLITGVVRQTTGGRIITIGMYNKSNYKPLISVVDIYGNRHNVYYIDMLSKMRYDAGMITLEELKLEVVCLDKDYTNCHIDNVIYQDKLGKYYYKDQEGYNKYVINTCSILPEYDTIEYRLTLVEEGYYITKNINSMYHIDSRGYMYSQRRLIYCEPKISSLGYPILTYTDDDGAKRARNVIRILAKYFLDAPDDKNIIAYDKNNLGKERSHNIPTIDNIGICTRREITIMYHNANKDHYDKYLRGDEEIPCNAKKVYVNDILFNMVKDATNYIIEQEKLRGVVRSKLSVASRISKIINNKNKSIYKRYAIKGIKDGK